MSELTWFKSSYSDSGGGECVEVATPSTVHIRDSKRPDAEHVTVSPTTWAFFLGHLTAV
ncbi:DUF397 domain-containing protein [Streptomyces sp. NPDC102270]|uniref:DUF397 domain-containing protein n=1 Tax=Streptomyces sp. NPDC102270 TaxID=3366150 RepID=UPI003814E73E